MTRHFFNQLIEVDMKTLLTAVACVSLLAACQREEPAPVAADPVVVAPADTTPVAPAAEMPAATDNMDVAPATTTTDTTTMPATTTTPAAGTGTSGSSAAGAMQGSGAGMYMVERGDTLWGIAQKNGVSHRDLAEWNNIDDPSDLRAGQELRLSAP